ncbi:hypothetical protein CA13_61250 [Planctomycetes bacterium CA13]|uniref:Uncharacterized protein n=1 Tax=Novipirellula herctigrandis TaxID=2527986 RepID=A0A5C5ZBX1_9BACT|nr:hypothetical protein CA13_61250 [Planctomycetes bacterium CA13]
MFRRKEFVMQAVFVDAQCLQTGVHVLHERFGTAEAELEVGDGDGDGREVAK